MPKISQGEIFRYIRLALGFTQKNVADYLGVFPHSVRCFEKGRSNFKDKTILDKFYDFIQTHSNNFNYSFLKGHRYYISDSNVFDDSGDMKPETGKGCVFIYLRKEGKHHLFKEECGGWSRTYTDIQLRGKKIKEVKPVKQLNSRLHQDKQALEHLVTLKDELSKRNMKITHLSKALHLNNSVVYQWVIGTCCPTPDNYNKLADFFGWPRFLEGLS